MGQKIRGVAVVSRSWYPNHQVLFEAFQDRLRLNITYLLLAWKERHRPWVFPSTPRLTPRVIPGLRLRIVDKEVCLNFGVAKYLEKVEPEVVVITPWSEPGCFSALNFAKSRSIPVVAWVPGLRLQWHPNLFMRVRSRISRLIAKRFMNCADKVFVYGTKAREDAIGLGVLPEKILVVRHCVDERHFDWRNPAITEDHVRAIRLHIDLEPGFVFLCVAQLLPRKGIDVLLRAFDQLRKMRGDARLLLVGDGPMRSRVRAYRYKHRGKFDWLPSLPYSDMPALYRLANCVVVPSHFDDWCTVVNEAQCSKIPVICSEGADAVHDLVVDGQTGLRFRPGDVDALVNCMRYSIDNVEELRCMAERAYEFILSEWNTEKSSEIWAEGISSILND